MMFNAGEPPFDDPAMMVAFVQAMDRQVVAETIWEDRDPLPAGLLPESSPSSTLTAAYAEPDLEAAQATVSAYVDEHGPPRCPS